MMKTFGLVLALLFVTGVACFAEVATIDIYSGFNLVAAPIVPFDPSPSSVFAAAPFGIDGLLSRWDPNTGGIFYDELEDPPGASFGAVLLGDGYWLQQFDTATISFEGVADGVPDAANVKTDMWISLPGKTDGSGGWHLIGHPFNHDTMVDDGSGTGANILFTDGTTVKNWSEAAGSGWVSDLMSGWNAVTGGVNVQFDGLGDDDTLRAGKGYWIQTFKSNIAMIIPAE